MNKLSDIAQGILDSGHMLEILDGGVDDVVNYAEAGAESISYTEAERIIVALRAWNELGEHDSNAWYYTVVEPLSD